MFGKIETGYKFKLGVIRPGDPTPVWVDGSFSKEVIETYLAESRSQESAIESISMQLYLVFMDCVQFSSDGERNKGRSPLMGE